MERGQELSRGEFPDLGLLTAKMAWGEVPPLEDFPDQLLVPPFIARKLNELLQITLQDTIKPEEALSRLKKAITPTGWEKFKRFLFHNYDRTQQAWGEQNLFLTCAELIAAALRDGRRVRLECSVQFKVNRLGVITASKPFIGSPASTISTVSLHDKIIEERPTLYVHTHPVPEPPAVPTDLIPLLSVYQACYGAQGFPLEQTAMVVNEQDTWAVLRSARTPLLEPSELDPQNMFIKWVTLPGDGQERLLAFADEYHLAVYRGSSANPEQMQRVRP